MARRNRTPQRKDKTEAAESEPAAEPPIMDTTAAPAAKPSAMRRLFWPAAIFVAVWWAVLIGLVIFTANPITLNRRQIHIAKERGLIVTAKVIDVDKGKVEVLKDWTAESSSTKELTVAGLKDLGAKNNRTYILALTASNKGGLRVTPAPDSSLLPPIYPATEESERQLEELLDEWK